jgi:hypothetical protein
MRIMASQPERRPGYPSGAPSRVVFGLGAGCLVVLTVLVGCADTGRGQAESRGLRELPSEQALAACEVYRDLAMAQTTGRVRVDEPQQESDPPRLRPVTDAELVELARQLAERVRSLPDSAFRTAAMAASEFTVTLINEGLDEANGTLAAANNGPSQTPASPQRTDTRPSSLEAALDQTDPGGSPFRYLSDACALLSPTPSQQAEATQQPPYRWEDPTGDVTGSASGSVEEGMVDIVAVTATPDDDRVTVTIELAEPPPRDAPGSSGVFVVQFDTDGDGTADRTLEGGSLGIACDVSGFTGGFSDSATARVPYECLGSPDAVRLRAEVTSDDYQQALRDQLPDEQAKFLGPVELEAP